MTRSLDMRVAGRHPTVTSQPKTDFIRAERPKELSPPPVTLRGQLLRLWRGISSNHEGFLKCYFMRLLAHSLWLSTIFVHLLCFFFFSPSDVLVQKTERAKGTKGTQRQRYTSAFFQLISGMREMSPCSQGDELKNVINVGWTMTLRPRDTVYNSLFNHLFQLNMNAKHTEGQQEEWEGEQAEKLNTKI